VCSSDLEKAAPVARMMPALAQVDDEIEIAGAAVAERDGGPIRRDARAVGADEDVGGEIRLVGLDDVAHAGGAVLLAGLDHEFGVEAELAADREDGLQRQHVDRVLALIVGRAPAVELFAVALYRPGRQALAPVRIVAE